MISEITNPVIFISQSVGLYFRYFFARLVYFLTLVVLTVGTFFLVLKVFGSVAIFMALLPVILAVDILLRPYFFMKWQYPFNYAYLNYLKSGPDERDPLPHSWRSEIGQMKHMVNSPLSHWVLSRLIVALAACHRSGTCSDLTPETIKELKQQTRRLLLIETLILLGFFLPFFAVSFLLTLGQAWVIKVLAFTLALYFGYFLNGILTAPLFSLVLVRRIYTD